MVIGLRRIHCTSADYCGIIWVLLYWPVFYGLLIFATPGLLKHYLNDLSSSRKIDNFVILCIVILNDSFDLRMCFDLLIWILGWRLKYLQIAKNGSFYKFKDSMVTAPLEVMVFLLLVKLLLLISFLMPCDCIIIIMFTEQPLTWRTLRLTTLYRKQTGYQRTTTLDDKGNNSWHGRWMTQKESINHLTENWTDQIKKEKEKKKRKSSIKNTQNKWWK